MAQKHLQLTSDPQDIINFASEQATLLLACRKVDAEIINHHRSYHRKLINKQRPAPRIYAVGDHVFAKRSVKSDAKRKGRVGKL